MSGGETGRRLEWPRLELVVFLRSLKSTARYITLKLAFLLLAQVELEHSWAHSYKSRFTLGAFVEVVFVVVSHSRILSRGLCCSWVCSCECNLRYMASLQLAHWTSNLKSLFHSFQAQLELL